MSGLQPMPTQCPNCLSRKEEIHIWIRGVLCKNAWHDGYVQADGSEIHLDLGYAIEGKYSCMLCGSEDRFTRMPIGSEKEPCHYSWHDIPLKRYEVNIPIPHNTITHDVLGIKVGALSMESESRLRGYSYENYMDCAVSNINECPTCNSTVRNKRALTHTFNPETCTDPWHGLLNMCPTCKYEEGARPEPDDECKDKWHIQIQRSRVFEKFKCWWSSIEGISYAGNLKFLAQTAFEEAYNQGFTDGIERKTR